MTHPDPESLPRARRRALGSYYTPERIVSHVVSLSIGPLLERLRAPAPAGRLDEVLQWRILDPAMGDGRFLRAAADLSARRLAGPAGLDQSKLRDLVVGRCLHGVEIDPTAAAAARAALRPAARRSNLHEGDFLAEDGPAATLPPLDAVIGNPPWGGWNRTLTAEAKRSYRARFSTARGRIDPFALFMERSTALLSPGGMLGLVLPDYFLLKNYPSSRRHVLDHYQIEELARWGEAFPDVHLDACTLIARRNPSPAAASIRCLPEGPGGRVVIAPRERFERGPGFVFNLSLDEEEDSLLARLESEGVRLGDWLEAHEGIHSGNVREKIFIPPDRVAPPGRRASLRPLIMGGGEVRPFQVSRRGWNVLWDRRVIKKAQGEYANLGEERWFTSPKILVRRTGDRIIAACDRTGAFASNNVFVASPTLLCPVPLEFLEGYLNSSLATWCFRAFQPREGRPFAELKLVHLNRLPVPASERLAGGESTARIVSLVAQVKELLAAEAVPEAAAARETLDQAFLRLARLSPPEARLLSRSRIPKKRFTPAPSPL